MNTIWKAKPPTTNGIVEFMRVRLLSFSMVLGIGFLLLVSLILSAILAAVGDYLGMFLPGGAAVGQALNATVSLVVVTALFAMIYKILPDTPVAWRDVWLGALVTSFLFTSGSSRSASIWERRASPRATGRRDRWSSCSSGSTTRR